MKPYDLEVALTRLAEGLEMALKSKRGTLMTPFRLGAWGTGEQRYHSLR